MKKNRLDSYFYEASKHKEHIQEAKEVISIPIESYESLNRLEKFALNTLIFRFSKLQDLIGAKIFRAYLEYSGFPVDGISFFEILKAIEKENITDIDSWNELREIRNDIAHEYPQERDEIVEKINTFIKKSDELLLILARLEERYYEIEQKRD